MTRLMMLLFAGLTIGAAVLTYYNVGLEETKYEEYGDGRSVRGGSAGFAGNGGYRTGK
ncbi:MAG: Unknown protein [uncultured Thiotrichaceae bacterium]|uniref:Uncharacterized protein n=1 Tax=uncultured Thiotrichaceae bacterium TaxID=298394 RepID=A0A6S6TA03_9GAMM|nr:MAG: Unknown protein [uncultured Thiotrichaceae bacterium]